MELNEEVGESASTPGHRRSLCPKAIAKRIYSRLAADGSVHAIYNPELADELEAHFDRLPARYILDMKDKPGDILLHKRILAEARDPEKRPAFRCRFVQVSNTDLRPMVISSISTGFRITAHEEDQPSNRSGGEIDFAASSMLKELRLDRAKNGRDNEKRRYITEGSSGRNDLVGVPVHEIIFSTVDMPMLLSQLSALLSGIGLNIREAHVFSTADGYSLDIFIVDGWKNEETNRLGEAVAQAIATSELKFSCSYQRKVERVLKFQQECNWEINRSFLMIGEKIASGYRGDLYHGLYLGVDVAVKVFTPAYVDEALNAEFNREVNILREVRHSNVVQFIGANTKPPHMCLVTEYISRGSLFDFLHKLDDVLEFHLQLKFAIDICKGMDYLHQHNIIHRDLKTANLLMDAEDVVKVADFGLARFQNPDGEMTRETGTYRWMAPEIMNHQPYDHKADVFSFGIVLWELATSKIPYSDLTPIQAALCVIKVVVTPNIIRRHALFLMLSLGCYHRVYVQSLHPMLDLWT
ncbi:unnamed protein product [Spirodela intermedia]|uniref:Uncharacterized protein n=1 Tax=Spirodela intermedia TaxID=51605 RepID=A0A7I8IRB3_SPIIN|nr:unnamed protein product [Spirodela intermedia]CAA6660521.1 unnamed protein product [Spirodela intermedia]